MKVNSKLLLLIVSLCGILTILSFRYNSFFDLVATTLKRYTEEYPQEKIYLHIDKPYYTAGEIIWLKAYLVAGSHHEPSTFSKAILVDLINQDGQLTFEIKLSADLGFAEGQINLPDTLHSGNYALRAYTSWMRNFNNAFFFEKEIKIWNPGAKLSNQIAENNMQLDLQFFPEGGNLVEGIRSRVGLKAVGADGYGKEVKGIIIDQQGTFITAFESNPLGMGAFEFVPEDGVTYFGKLEKEDAQPFPLPQASKTGFVLNITESHEHGDVLIRIQTNEATLNKSVALIAQCRGVLEYILQPDLSDNFALIRVPKDKHLNGITQFTLFNGQVPVAERLMFIDQEEQVTLEITPDKKVYSPREKITLRIKATDKNNQPVQGNFSLSVLDAKQMLLNPNAEHITANLLLSSELVGLIENSGYYFNPENEDRKQALDALLLTQGWRRFVWQDILAGKWPALNYPIQQGINLTGTLQDVLSKKPIADGKVTLLSNNPHLVFLEAISGKDGRFAFHNLQFYDTADIFLQGTNKRNRKTVIFEIDPLDKPTFGRTVQPLALQLTDYEKNYLERSSERQQIDASYTFDERVIILDPVDVLGEHMSDEPFKIYGKGSRTIRTSEIPGAETFFHPYQYLQGRVAGVQVVQNGPYWNISIRGSAYSSVGAGTKPLIMIDNIPIESSSLESINPLGSINPRDIESIEIFRGPEAAIFGASGANGAILFYTKRGKYRPVTREGAITFTSIGFQAHREFYSPRYDVKQPRHIKPDYRATIYWNPNIVTDSLGNTTLDFFTNDNESIMMGVLEGLSFRGQPATARFSYQVEKR
ncbi:MAG: TonB-dependent receptor plug domain-containing protein [Cyclobacteriaceae bacterium]|nr:TonB-dependent receptor plug domain-containing protein [Cyclobacteriaceae bacterium]